MKIACCTMEMIALIFLLFVSLNGGYSYLDGTDDGFAPASTTELLSTWGEPDTVVFAEDLGFLAAQLGDVEVWSYEDLARSVIVRGGTVVAIQEG